MTLTSTCIRDNASNQSTSMEKTKVHALGMLKFDWLISIETLNFHCTGGCLMHEFELHSQTFQADPLIWVFGHFWLFAPSYRKSRGASCVKIALKNSKEKLVKCATEVARLYRVSIQSCTQNQPSPIVQSLWRDWIQLFYRLDYLHETWHTYSACSWLQNCASDFSIFARSRDLVMVFKVEKRGKIITKLWKIIT